MDDTEEQESEPLDPKAEAYDHFWANYKETPEYREHVRQRKERLYGKKPD